MQRWENFEDIYNRLDTIPACDRRMDMRTDILRRHSPRYAYASRGKNLNHQNSRDIKSLSVHHSAAVVWTPLSFFWLYIAAVKISNGLRVIVSTDKQLKVKVNVWTLAIALLTWVRLETSSALQSRKWQLIGMSQWCRSALCGHPLPALTDSWIHGAASRHTIVPISHTRPSPRSRSYYSFPVPLRVGGWVRLRKQ